MSELKLCLLFVYFSLFLCVIYHSDEVKMINTGQYRFVLFQVLPKVPRFRPTNGFCTAARYCIAVIGIPVDWAFDASEMDVPRRLTAHWLIARLQHPEMPKVNFFSVSGSVRHSVQTFCFRQNGSRERRQTREDLKSKNVQQ